MIDDPRGWLDEFLHMQQQGANNQISGLKSCFIGYIVKWFPNNYVIVSNTLGGTCPGAQDNTNANSNALGIPILTPPIPLATMFSAISNAVNPINNAINAGIVLAPLGGAAPTSAQQAVGEQVLVLNINNDIGSAVCAFMLFNDRAVAPSMSIPVTGQQLVAGEWLAVSPTGTHTHWKLSGDVLVYTMQPNPTIPGGNLNLFATGLGAGGGTGGAITLQTGLINTVPTPAEISGDIWLRSISNIEMRSVDIGLETSFVISIVAHTDLNLEGDNSANLQSSIGDVNLLATTSINGSGGESVNFASINGGSNMQLVDQTTLTAATDLTLNAQGLDLGTGNINANAAQDAFWFGSRDAWITADQRDCHVVSNNGNVFINNNVNANVNPIAITTNGNFTANANQDIDLTAGNNVNFFSFVDTNITSLHNFNMNAANNMQIVSQATGVIQSNNNLRLVTNVGGNSIFISAGTNIVAEAFNGSATLRADNGPVTVSSLTGPANLTAGTGINLIANNGDLSLTVIGKLNSMQFQTDPAGVFEINAGTISITSGKDQNIGIAATGIGTITLITGTNITLMDGSGNGVLELLTTAFMTAFNNHTHSAGAVPPPDAQLAPGYPLTTNATLSN